MRAKHCRFCDVALPANAKPHVLLPILSRFSSPRISASFNRFINKNKLIITYRIIHEFQRQR
jgi:hypothetical protein